MTTSRARWPLWLATLALLWASLSTVLARAWVDDGAGRIEICTSTGVAWVAVGDSVSDDAPFSGLTPIHCDWCLVSASVLGLPADVAPTWIDAAQVGGLPIEEGGLRAADRDRWWRPALRAPPR